MGHATPQVLAAALDVHAQAVAPPLPAGLQLDLALTLLQQAGWQAPEGAAPSSVAWMQALIDGLCEVSSRDPLTGLVNRRHFELALAREIDRVARAGEPALLLALDIDHFKHVNDDHGHAAGDLVLQSMARTLTACVRPMDTVARLGGEEFAIILPNCPPGFGLTVAERIRRQVARQASVTVGGQALSITVSVGGAFAPQWVRSSGTLWAERADQQLYRAKSEGRNRTCLEMPTLSMVSSEEKNCLFGLFGLPVPTESPEAFDLPFLDEASGLGGNLPTTTP